MGIRMSIDGVSGHEIADESRIGQAVKGVYEYVLGAVLIRLGGTSGY